MSNTENQEPQEEKSFFSIVVHSFFIIPFLIAVFCVLLFAGIHLLTQENRTAYDYLEDVKTGGVTKRWQGAFELSKMLANPETLPQEERFTNELISAFEHSAHDDNRVRQYLALAMGRTGNKEYLTPLLNSLTNEKEENLPAVIYALGMLGDAQASKPLIAFINHPDARIRSITVVALGNIGDPTTKGDLRKKIADTEPNVQWGAAISLAKMGDGTGKPILTNLLNRKYLEQFEEVDHEEQNHLILAAIESSGLLKDQDLLKIVKDLSQTDQNMKVRAAAYNQLKD